MLSSLSTLSSLEKMLTIDAVQAMHKGVERDMEKQRVREERQAEFEMQKRLEEEYLKLQTVSSSTGEQKLPNQNSNIGT